MTIRLLSIPVITEGFITDSSTEMSGLESEEASEDEISAHDEDWTPDVSILSGTGDREQRGEITNGPGKGPGKGGGGKHEQFAISHHSNIMGKYCQS